MLENMRSCHEVVRFVRNSRSIACLSNEFFPEFESKPQMVLIRSPDCLFSKVAHIDSAYNIVDWDEMICREDRARPAEFKPPLPLETGFHGRVTEAPLTGDPGKQTVTSTL